MRIQLWADLWHKVEHVDDIVADAVELATRDLRAHNKRLRRIIRDLQARR